MSKTRVKQAIIRKIKTDNFESLDVIVEIEEEIEWQSEEERSSEMKKVSGRLQADFVATYDEVARRLGVDRCIGTVDTNIQTNNKSSNNDLDFDL